MNKKISISLLSVFFIHCSFFTKEEKNELELLWEIRIERSFPPFNPVRIDDERIIATGNHINCISIKTGELLWKYKISDKTTHQAENLLFDNKHIYVTHWEGKNPDGTIPDHYQSIICLDKYTGNKIWKIDLPSEKRYYIDEYNELIDDQLFIVAYNSTDKYFYLNIIDKNTASIINEFRPDYHIGSVSSYNNNILIGGSFPIPNDYPLGRRLSKVNLMSKDLNSVIWEWSDTTGIIFECPPVIENEISYFGFKDIFGSEEFSGLHAIDLKTGTTIWSMELGCTNMTVEEEYIYLAEEAIVSKIDKITGKIKWTTPMGSTGGGPLVIYDDLLYYSHWGTVKIMDLDTGEVLEDWRGPDKAQVHGLAVYDDILFVQSGGHLFAFK